MYKKIMLLGFVVAVVAFSNLFFGQVKQSGIFLDNVEALTSNETVDNYWCCGKTEVCAKGDNVTIKGKLSTSPCSD